MSAEDRGFTKAEFWNACEQIRIYLTIWNDNREAFKRDHLAEDPKTLLDLYVNLYNHIYASRYTSKVFEAMSPLGLEYAAEAFVLSAQIQEMEKEATEMFLIVSPKVKALMINSEFQKIVTYCDRKFGSSKYDLNLGTV